MPTTVLADGTVIPDAAPITEPGKIPQLVPGSHLQAAAQSVNTKISDQASALNALGGKIGGRRGSRRAANLAHVRRMMMLGGAGDIEVKNIPHMASAGGVDPKSTYAGILAVQSQGAANRQFDGLGDAPAKLISATGGRRHKKKTRKVHNGIRSKHGRVRKHRGSSRRTHRLRRTRR